MKQALSIIFGFIVLILALALVVNIVDSDRINDLFRDDETNVTDESGIDNGGTDDTGGTTETEPPSSTETEPPDTGEDPDDGGSVTPDQVTVSFSADGCDGDMADVAVTKGSEYTLPECGFTHPGGSVFDKWKTSDGTEYAVGSVVTVDADITFIAVWAEASSEEAVIAAGTYKFIDTLELGSNPFNYEDFNINFTSNENTYTKMYIQGADAYLYYGGTLAYEGYGSGWVDELYKYVTVTEAVNTISSMKEWWDEHTDAYTGSIPGEDDPTDLTVIPAGTYTLKEYLDYYVIIDGENYPSYDDPNELTESITFICDGVTYNSIVWSDTTEYYLSYDNNMVYMAAWNDSKYRTITLPEDCEVSSGFAIWFDTNCDDL